MDTNNLIVWLPFDASTTTDHCGGEWTAFGEPVIRNGKLYLDGNSSYVAKDAPIELGGQDFTICGQFIIGGGTWAEIFKLYNANKNAESIYFERDTNSQWVYVNVLGKRVDPNIGYSSAIRHFEIDYVHADGTAKFFLNGVLRGTITKTVDRTTFENCRLGYSLLGTIDEFMIFDGVALHTENFTPPTDDDYFNLKLAEFGSVATAETADFERITRNKPNIEDDACYKFTRVSDNYASIPIEVLGGATEFTIEIKFATTDTTSTSTNYLWGNLIGRDIAGWNKGEFSFAVNNNVLCLWLDVRSGYSPAFITDKIVNDGQIHVAAVRSNADGSIDIFCDGELIFHQDDVGFTVQSSYPLIIAQNNNTGQGTIAMDFYEARLWRVARDEIFADIDGSEDGLEAWYLPTPAGIVDYSPNVQYATVYGATYAWHAADTADLERVLAVFHIIETADLERVIHVHTTETADLERITATHATATVDLERVVINHVDTTADLERVVINRVDETADLERITATHATATGDIERIVFTRVNETGDLERVVIARVDETADLERITATHATDNADLERVVITRVEKTADLERVLGIRATETADLERITATHSAATADLERVVNARITETADLERVLIGVQPTLPKLAFSVRHLGEIINAPLKYSATPIAPALTVRWLGYNWYNPLVQPYSENATPIIVYYGGNRYALSATISSDIIPDTDTDTDTEIWRYENAGTVVDNAAQKTLTDLPESQSRTGTAFYTATKHIELSDFSTHISELWAKFDVYCSVDTEITKQMLLMCGFTRGLNDFRSVLLFGQWDSAGENSTLHYVVYDGTSENREPIATNPFKLNQLQTVLMHVILGNDNGAFEVWVDGEKFYDYHGNLHNGKTLTHVVLGSTNDHRTLFSNIIISNGKIDFDEIVST